MDRRLRASADASARTVKRAEEEAKRAQSAAITQISAMIGTMDRSTQQNAAMVEETSAAARNLAGEIGNLADRASLFRVTKGLGWSSGSPARIGSWKNGRLHLTDEAASGAGDGGWR